MNYFKETRAKLNLSQAGFAKYLDIPVANIQKWEQGISQPPRYVKSLIERVILLEKGAELNGKS